MFFFNIKLMSNHTQYNKKKYSPRPTRIATTTLPIQNIEFKGMETETTTNSHLNHYLGDIIVDHHFLEEDDEKNGEGEEEEEDEWEDDDSSCASTVANDKPPRLVRPPPSATQEEQAKFYWELCYGKESRNDNSSSDHAALTSVWSANRNPPSKSCLSAKKVPWTEKALSSKKCSDRRKNNVVNRNQKSTPTVCDQFKFQQEEINKLNKDNSSSVEMTNHNDDNNNNNNHQRHNTPIMKTPQSNDDNESDMKSVKFGNASAAEFESSQPTSELTPLPSEKVRERYPVDEEYKSSDDESTELHHETARNGEVLAMWDDDFDEYINGNIEMDDDELSDEGNLSSASNAITSDRRRSKNTRRNDNDRRSSVFFSRDGGSLVENISPQQRKKRSFDNSDARSKIEFGQNVSIDDHDESKYSPISRGDSMHSLSRRSSDFFRLSTSDSDSSRQHSLQYSSPCTSESYHFSHSESDHSKVTPKAELSSSSLVLRSVHSEGGASLGQNHHSSYDDATQDLKPSQLDNTLRQAERNHLVQEDNSSFIPRVPLMDEIIRQIFIDSDTKAMSANYFGELMRDRSNFFSSSFKVAISALLNKILSNVELHSFPRISEAILQSKDNCQDYVFERIISCLEQEISKMESCDRNEIRRISSFMHQRFDSEERTDMYSPFIEAAFWGWDDLESRSFETGNAYSRRLSQKYQKEEATLVDILNKINTEKSTCISNLNRKSKKLRKEINEEICIVKDIEAKIQAEQKELGHFSTVASYWSNKVDVEMNFPLIAIDYQMLDEILAFDQRSLMVDKIDLSYPHINGELSETIISWVSENHDRNEARQSLCSTDTSLSSDGMMELLSTTPTIDCIQGSRLSCDNYLPKESVAHKMNSMILGSTEMSLFLSQLFKQEQETAIQLTADVFQRVDLLAIDMMELQKYYSCRVKRSPKSSSIVMHVTISLGGQLSLEIRFTYDLSIANTILYCIPSDIFILSVVGEPATPINVLLQVAKKIVFNEQRLNAFLLKRTCSAVVDTLQIGRMINL